MPKLDSTHQNQVPVTAGPTATRTFMEGPSRGRKTAALPVRPELNVVSVGAVATAIGVAEVPSTSDSFTADERRSSMTMTTTTMTAVAVSSRAASAANWYVRRMAACGAT